MIMTSTAIAKVEPLPVPAPGNLMPAWPKWMLAIEKDLHQNPSEDGGLWELPASLIPTDAQRAVITAQGHQLAAFLSQTPAHGEKFGKSILLQVANLLGSKPSQAGDLESKKARIDSYMQALQHIPVWAVQTVIYRWHCGECDRPYDHPPVRFDYTWAPSSADLCQLAKREVREVRRRMLTCERALKATAPKYTAEYRAEMKDKLRSIGIDVEEATT
jgi:hypothetical protein